MENNQIPSPVLNDWMKLIGPVNMAGAEMEALVDKYGVEVMAIIITIFWENLPDNISFRVEQYRRLNTKFQGTIAGLSSKSISKKLVK